MLIIVWSAKAFAMRYSFFIACFISLLLSACRPDKAGQTADIILLNGNIYTVDAALPWAEAAAIRGDRIVAVGDNGEIEKLRGDNTELVDLRGRFVMPGFIEGHGHYSGLGNSLMNLNFLRAGSWEEIVDAVAQRAKDSKPGEWITGRGWHQEKWDSTPTRNVLGYPYHDALSVAAPDNPVLLRHASGHSLFANAKAMELAGISRETPNPSGGEIVRDARGQVVGVFEETAMGLIGQVYQEYLEGLSPEERKEQWLRGIRLAEEECLKNGVTSFQDAGSSFQEIAWYRELAESGALNVRLWVMIRHPYEALKDRLDDLPMVGLGGNFFTCAAIKSAVDGALGAFGAWLLEPYDDKPKFMGQNTVSIAEVRNIADLAWEKRLQLCVHAIGDRANRETLDIFQRVIQREPQRDHRWRVEHAQHLHPDDIPRFRQLGVIASMQGIHCTSDAPFVVKRLGAWRARTGAYPWRALLNAGAVVTNGTDAPVEDVSPIESFYATVTRRRVDNKQEFFPEQKLSREEAIHTYTLANAYAAFEENLKGSITPGKLADIVVLSNDLIRCAEADILNTQTLLTIVGGKIKWGNKEAL
jgi:predicted amidohydrolase YtcJ